MDVLIFCKKNLNFKFFSFSILFCSLISFFTQKTEAFEISYFLKLAAHQARILTRAIPIDKILQNPDINTELKHKLELSREVKKFCDEELGLAITKNYTQFVQLDEPYVSYVVNASPQNELKNYLWQFPIVGQVPYKGFPNKQDAEAEAKNLAEQKLDTNIRGVSAYSTLGWLKDPVLSSMIHYSDFDFVSTIIHETVHATIYIKNNADFNEQLATFLGDVGAELFYRKKEGAGSSTVLQSKKNNQDMQLFSGFVRAQADLLSEWYKKEYPKFAANERNEQRLAKLKQIQLNFQKDLEPKLQTKSFEYFKNENLNNATLLVYRTYYNDLTQFKIAYEKQGNDFKKFIQFCKDHLANEKEPSKILSSIVL